MNTVAHAFQSLIQNLELPPCKRTEASSQARVVRGDIESRLSVAQHFTSGSFGRGTAIQPLHDIDLFIVLNDTAHSELKAGAPAACLKAVRKALHEAHPNKELPELQRRSVNIEFSGTGIGFDIVPAFDLGDGVYQIPDRNADAWIQSNPRIHGEELIKANGVAGDKLVPLIKVLKRWKQSAGGALKSFHIEVMTYGVLQTPPKSYAEGLRDLFQGLSTAVLLPCPEPARLGPDLDQGMEQRDRERAAKALREALELADKAVDAAARGAVAEAHFYWKSVLGESYSEAGRAPMRSDAPVVIAATSSARTSVDAPTKRFG